MTPRRPLVVLFCAAAGPRQGFGHLVRSGSLASAIGVGLDVVLRAGEPVQLSAGRMGWRVHPDSPSLLRRLRPDLVVIDDPSPRHAARWRRRAAALGIPAVVVQDMRGRVVDADLVIDGSVAGPIGGSPADLQGPDFAILDREVERLRRASPSRQPQHAIIALGGGAHVRGVGVEITRRLRRMSPDLSIELAPGFSSAPLPALPDGCGWMDRAMLRSRLSAATVAVLGGGITLYEACALGTPAVAISVAPPQRRTIAAMAAHGAVIDASAGSRHRTIDRAVTAVRELLQAPDRRKALSVAAARLVDGRGTMRVAGHLRALILSGTSHAA
jgi:spore coat polysaccharide biosynthesis predicted glycosyltransferase SpsG